jgi:hypothetical protein
MKYLFGFIVTSLKLFDDMQIIKVFDGLVSILGLSSKKVMDVNLKHRCFYRGDL